MADKPEILEWEFPNPEYDPNKNNNPRWSGSRYVEKEVLEYIKNIYKLQKWTLPDDWERLAKVAIGGIPGYVLRTSCGGDPLNQNSEEFWCACGGWCQEWVRAIPRDKRRRYKGLTEEE